MGFTPFDFNEAIAQRREHALEGLRHGSPVIGISLDEGLLIVTVRRTQRKVYEIYDRLIYSAIGNQSDIEAVRLGAVDLAAREGFERSPDDVTAQRLVGFSLSPALKEVFRDQWRAPSVIRAVFGELGNTPDEDVFFILNYDGEFSQHTGVVALAGTPEAEERMRRRISGLPESLRAAARETHPETDQSAPTDRTEADSYDCLASAIAEALHAWAIGVMALDDTRDREEDDAEDDLGAVVTTLREHLENGCVEAAMLDRRLKREAKFVMLPAPLLDRAVAIATERKEA